MHILDKCLENIDKKGVPSPAKLATLKGNLKNAQELVDNLYGFEGSAKSEIEAKIAEISTEVSKENKRGYKRFANLDMLKWRDKDGNPRIVLFSLDSPTFELRVDSVYRYSMWSDGGTRGTQVRSHLPRGPLREAYSDVIEGLRTKVKRHNKGYSLSCQYSGIIPASTRKKIEEAIKVFGLDGVFILAEGANFKTKEHEELKVNVGDPLVVGWDGNSLWLIDKFDLTTIEQLVAAEFTL